MARLLILSSTLPYPGVGTGGGSRLMNLLEHLSWKHELTLLSFRLPSEESKIDSLRRYCRIVETVSTEHLSQPFPSGFFMKALHLFMPRWTDDALKFKSEVFLGKLRKLFMRVQFDGVLVEFPEMGLYLQDLPPGPFRIYDSHEARSVNLLRLAALEARFLKRLYLLSQYRKMRAYERWLCASYDIVLALTRKDERYFRKISSRARVVFLPTGVDLGRFEKRTQPGRKNDILYIGFYGNVANADAVGWFVHDIFPGIREKIPEARFLIVGSSPTEKVQRLAREPGVEVTGYVPDLAQCLADCAVFVAPIRLGGGIRGKVLEAMAVGVPIVATSIAVEGLGAEPGRHFVLADEPRQFAQAVVALLQDARRSVEISTESRQFVERHYDWKENINALLDILEDATTK